MIRLQRGQSFIGVVLAVGALFAAFAFAWLGLAAKAISDLFFSDGWVLLATGIVCGVLALATAVVLLVRAGADPGTLTVRLDAVTISCPGLLTEPWVIRRDVVRLVTVDGRIPTSRYAPNAIPVASVWPARPNVAIVFQHPVRRPKLRVAPQIVPFIDPGPAWRARESGAVAVAVTDVGAVERAFASWDVLGPLTWAERERLPKRTLSPAMIVLILVLGVVWAGRWIWRLAGLP